MKKNDKQVLFFIFTRSKLIWFTWRVQSQLRAPFASNKMIGSSYSTNDRYPISFNRVAVMLSIVLFVIIEMYECEWVCDCVFVCAHLYQSETFTRYSPRITWSAAFGVRRRVKNTQWYHWFLCDEKKEKLSRATNKRPWNKSYPHRLMWIDIYRNWNMLL